MIWMLLGIDAGGTTSKAVVFTEDGLELGSGFARTVRNSPRHLWAERDMADAWTQCVSAIVAALTEAGACGRDIDAVGICGHSDGLYPVTDQLSPARSAILAVDSRAKYLIDRWREQGVLDQVRGVTGQQLFESSQATLCAWLTEHEPGTLAQTRWLLSAKDWLRLCLTGNVGTDLSEAMACFGRLDGAGYEPRVCDVLEIRQLIDRLPPIFYPTDVAGTVTSDAAARTGLCAGTPVVYGTHDVVAGALGSGITWGDRYCVVAGTWGVNEILSSERIIDERWQSRPWIDSTQWLHMAASPASASNLGWLLETVFSSTDDVSNVIERVESVLDDPSDLLFYPFLYGSPYGSGQSGAFLGLHGWHRREHLAKAVMEGVVFNHTDQLNDLRARFGNYPIRLTGGASRSTLWAQLLADATGAEIEIPETSETGCWGAALCAAIGTGHRSSVIYGGGDTIRIRAHLKPAAPGENRVVATYNRYQLVRNELERIWPLLVADGTVPA